MPALQSYLQIRDPSVSSNVDGNACATVLSSPVKEHASAAVSGNGSNAPATPDDDSTPVKQRVGPTVSGNGSNPTATLGDAGTPEARSDAAVKDESTSQFATFAHSVDVDIANGNALTEPCVTATVKTLQVQSALEGGEVQDKQFGEGRIQHQSDRADATESGVGVEDAWKSEAHAHYLQWCAGEKVEPVNALSSSSVLPQGGEVADVRFMGGSSKRGKGKSRV